MLRSGHQRTFEAILFAMFGALMFASKIAMAALPNIHLLGMFIMLFTILFRWKALIPVYLYVLIEGISQGFSMWWVPDLYIWTILWGVTMLLPRRMPQKVAAFVYPIVCGLYGFSFGTLGAPAYALLFRLDLAGMLAWIVSGIPFDAIHGASNLAIGMLILPLSELLRKLLSKYINVH